VPSGSYFGDADVTGAPQPSTPVPPERGANDTQCAARRDDLDLTNPHAAAFYNWQHAIQNRGRA
jgi:hypothetical protein